MLKRAFPLDRAIVIALLLDSVSRAGSTYYLDSQRWTPFRQNTTAGTTHSNTAVATPATAAGSNGRYLEGALAHGFDRRALERDEDAIARWVKVDRPRIRQNARRRGAWLMFLDEGGVGFTPPAW